MAEESQQAKFPCAAPRREFPDHRYQQPASHQVIGEMDRFTVPMLLHERAIYMHEGNQYQVEKLDFPNKKAFIRAVDVDYYTDADFDVSLKVLDCFDSCGLNQMQVHKGEGDGNEHRNHVQEDEA
jgi:ATP-dependent helicase YprA (DUF1998 family)